MAEDNAEPGSYTGIDSRKPRDPNLVFMDEKGGLKFWVHPSLPERPDITDLIKVFPFALYSFVPPDRSSIFLAPWWKSSG
ncbi:uncharacterized protein EI90DRAFT_3044749 [Cantharellus anzutake]|uniref:uncharacterized protein n=1 Tax=Cantharellus anzutake TaxID=1750568 RepID=UPI0019070C84|nr:uncharacterized protein EI90DRAFT_3044749 [Cantharellus anzutake]KAF8337061.1 hypothetical protein EI90DRAFT_3044749 [Cantharellus anzutake]